MEGLDSGAKVLVCAALIVVARLGCAQFTDPRNYENFPVGVNQIELAYGYARADQSVDPAIVIEGARLNLNQWTITYTRYFGLFGKTAWVAPSVPFAVLDGVVSGTSVSGSVGGAGDSGYEFAWLVKGAPALNPAEFTDYKPGTVVGVTLSVTAPTGLYKADRILNLGSDRWSFRPEIGMNHPFGPKQRWALDAYANSYFYTDNSSYQGTQVLRQGPLPAVEGHISYMFRENVMGSLDARCSFRGDTSINGIGQNDSQKNFILGTEWIIALNAKHELTFLFADALVHVNGPSAVGVSARYDYYWGRGYK